MKLIGIKKINVTAFRGITNLEINLQGKSLLLYGENGSGKSSLVDALEFFFTGKVSHLEGISGISLKQHGPNVKFSPDDVNIELTFAPNDLTLNRNFREIPLPTVELKEYFQITQKGTFIIRREQLLEFIFNKPADRFRAISNIIGLEPLDNIELEMKKLRDNLKGNVQSKKNEIDWIYKEISNILGTTITSNDGVLTTLNKILEESNFPSISSLEETNRYLEEMYKSVKKNKDNGKVSSINEILEFTNGVILVPEQVVEDIKDFNELIKKYLKSRERINISLVDLLMRGKEIIADGNFDICPLCEQRIEREELLSKITKRIKKLQALSDEVSEIRRKSSQIIDELKKILNKAKGIISRIEVCSEFSEQVKTLCNSTKYLETFINEIEAAQESRDEISIQEFCMIKDETNQVINHITSICTKLKDQIELTEQEKRLLENIHLIEQIKNKINDISKLSFELSRNTKYSEMADNIYTSFSNIKKAKVQEIYNTIQTDIQRFYSMLHPNEEHQNVELMVMLERRASTELKIDSFGRIGEDPRALTSEGHLDSLGLCIFLAFVKKFNHGCSLVILDDVVTTIDAGHRDRLAELLLKEFKDYQLIITTHDGIWYKELANKQITFKRQNNFINLQISRWTLDSGPVLEPYKTKWEKIETKLLNNDKSGAGNEGRIYLEWLLKEICEKMEIPITFKRNQKYTVSELYDPAEKWIKEKLKNSDLKEAILNSFKDLRSTTFMGNLLSHDNIEIENLSIEEVKNFCNLVHNLHNIFLCPECQKFLKRFKESNLIRCPDLKCLSSKQLQTK